ncbi:MAG: hypothetical protein PUP92_22040 [Rhizonema sp. PD38]|nr:hypothetical protein [Rhizonema sp. PD38]
MPIYKWEVRGEFILILNLFSAYKLIAIAMLFEFQTGYKSNAASGISNSWRSQRSAQVMTHLTIQQFLNYCSYRR